MYNYKVDTFLPKIAGCGAEDKGWDEQRCDQYQEFLNGYASKGWRLHSCEYREVSKVGGCGPTKGVWLVCTFEKEE